MDAFAWAAPGPASKGRLLHPARKYFGLAADGMPGDSKLYDTEDLAARRAPDLVEWFQYFDQAYPADKVTAAWQHGALPVITWMSAPAGFASRSDLSAYSLASITAGKHDGYLRAWAARIAVARLPVVIRFDHESNGNWYPWSVGWHSKGISDNTPARYRAAWQHVWNIFQAMGANTYTIWAYVPTRIDTLGTYGSGYRDQRALVAAAYPGNHYVDWVGVDGYQYDPSESTTYSQTFSASFADRRRYQQADPGGQDGRRRRPGRLNRDGSPRPMPGCSRPEGGRRLSTSTTTSPGCTTSTALPCTPTGNSRRRPAGAGRVSCGRGRRPFGAGVYPPYLLGD